jgi:hypothetical protein
LRGLHRDLRGLRGLRTHQGNIQEVLTYEPIMSEPFFKGK